MGKKGGWFSAIKRVFTPNSKEKLTNDLERKNAKEKKGTGKLRHGDTNSFIPLFREPSSIEKILGDAERDHKLIFTPPTPLEQPKTPGFVPLRNASPRIPSQRITSPKISSPRVVSPRVASPRLASPSIVQRRKEIGYRREPTLRNHNASATIIQAAYRGYMARRSFRALKGLVRLQGVIRGQNVKRQTMNAMKYMQLLVRVQSQIQSRRIQKVEKQARHQSHYTNDKDVDSGLGKWSTIQPSEAGYNEEWDDSSLTKEEVEARLQRKVEALIKRERAMAYAYSHQLWKTTPKSSAHTNLSDIRSGGFSRWWNWLEHQHLPTNPPEIQTTKTFQLTPSRPNTDMKPSPPSLIPHFNNYNMDTPTPRSSHSTIFTSTKHARTPISSRTPPQGMMGSKYSRPKSNGVNISLSPFKDDDSMTSCPPFSAPNYMTPTVAAKAKARANSNPKERLPGTPNNEKRRLSFPLTTQGIGMGIGIGSFKWNKGLFSNKGTSRSPIVVVDKSIGNLSVDSTVSMPAAVGRRPFNRFV